jgi:hypothetical protein
MLVAFARFSNGSVLRRFSGANDRLEKSWFSSSVGYLYSFRCVKFGAYG